MRGPVGKCRSTMLTLRSSMERLQSALGWCSSDAHTYLYGLVTRLERVRSWCKDGQAQERAHARDAYNFGPARLVVAPACGLSTALGESKETDLSTTTFGSNRMATISTCTVDQQREDTASTASHLATRIAGFARVLLGGDSLEPLPH